MIPTLGFDLQGPNGLSIYAADSNGIYFSVSARNGIVSGGMSSVYMTGYTSSDCSGDQYIPDNERPPANFSIQVQSFSGPPQYFRVLASETTQFVTVYGLQQQQPPPAPPDCSMMGIMPVVKLTPITAPSSPLFAGPATPSAT